jgi:ribosomal protein S18 acetylase RimI-like enzyme
MHSVRRIRRGDGLKLKAIRLQALLTDPDAFGSSYQSESTRNDEEWEMRAVRGAEGDAQFLAVVEFDDEFVGMAGAYQPDDRPSTRELYGMWVAPDFRSTGIGSQLVDAVKEWSIEAGAYEIDLWVVVDNRRARGLYLAAGFTDTGLSKPLPSNHSLTETRMTMPLTETQRT